MKRWIHIADQWTETERKEMMAYLRTFGDNKTTTEGKLEETIKEHVCLVLKGVPLSVKELQETTVYDPVYTHFENIKTALDEARQDFYKHAKNEEEFLRKARMGDCSFFLLVLKLFGDEKK